MACAFSASEQSLAKMLTGIIVKKNQGQDVGSKAASFNQGIFSLLAFEPGLSKRSPF